MGSIGGKKSLMSAPTSSTSLDRLSVVYTKRSARVFMVIAVLCFALQITFSLKFRSYNRIDKKEKQPVILHVISPFSIASCNDSQRSSFCPFDQGQSVAIASMRRSRKHSKNPDKILLAAITFPEDRDIIPPDFLHLTDLSRSTADVYPDVQPTKTLPFAQDILDSLLNIEYDYLVFTNSDIVVHQDFYDTIMLINRNSDAYTINRQGVPTTKSDGTLYTGSDSDLNEIYALNNLEEHSGYDCFVIKKKVVHQLDLGELFVGFPPFGSTIRAQLYSNHNRKMKEFLSFDLKLTYHLGIKGESTWNVDGGNLRDYRKINLVNAICTGNQAWRRICNDKNENEDWNLKCEAMSKRAKRFVDDKSDEENEKHKWHRVNKWCGKKMSQNRQSKLQIDKSNPKALHPPFRIVQVGKARTASTFQLQVLNALTHIKSPTGTFIRSEFFNRTSWEENISEQILMDAIEREESFVFKTHTLKKNLLEKLSNDGKIVVISSGGFDIPFAAYTQDREELEACNDCVINQYAELFDLTEKENRMVKKHLENYSILRQCCSMQMSKYEAIRLNGCDVNEYKDQPDYPHCEEADFTAIENDFHSSTIPFHANTPEYNWSKPGDCFYFRIKIASGRGFNDRPFSGCEFHGKTVGVKDSA